MAQVAFDELLSRNALQLGLAAVLPVVPFEGDALLADGHDSPVADGDAFDVGAEVFNGVGARAEGLDVDPPFHRPRHRIDFPLFGFESAPKMMPEGSLQNRDGNQKVNVRVKVTMK